MEARISEHGFRGVNTTNRKLNQQARSHVDGIKQCARSSLTNDAHYLRWSILTLESLRSEGHFKHGDRSSLNLALFWSNASNCKLYDMQWMADHINPLLPKGFLKMGATKYKGNSSSI